MKASACQARGSMPERRCVPDLGARVLDTDLPSCSDGAATFTCPTGGTPALRSVNNACVRTCDP